MSDELERSLEVEVLAAMLRADQRDSGDYLEHLATKLSATLPDHTRVERKGGLFSKNKPVQRISVELSDLRYAIARQKHGAVRLLDGRVMLAGGVYDDLRDWVPANAEMFDPATETFAAVRDMNTTHFKVLNAVVLMPSGKVCVAGGGAFVEVFDPATNLFSRVESPVNAARYYATATALLGLSGVSSDPVGRRNTTTWPWAGSPRR